MARDHSVEEVTQRRKMLIARRDAGAFGHALKILPHMAGGDGRQFLPAVLLDPCEELLYRLQIGAARVLIANGVAEEPLRGEGCVGAGAADDFR